MALFKRPLLQLVLEGKKTQTRRTHRRMWKVGKTYGVRDRWFTKPQGRITITRKFKQHLAEISHADARKEGFPTLNAFREAWTEIYGSWDPEQMVTVYEFKLQKADTQRLL